MAYFEQKVMSATAGGTSTNNDQILIVNGAIADSLINKAVTYDDHPADLANPKVKLASDGDIVIGSIMGVSYGKLQIAVGGWDIKFYSTVTSQLAVGSRIIGAQRSATDRGYIKVVPAMSETTWDTSARTEVDNLLKGRGAVFHGGTPATGGTAGSVLVRVSMIFGS